MEYKNKKYIFNLIILGNRNVGKSSIITNFLNETYNKNHKIPKINYFCSKTINLENNIETVLNITEPKLKDNCNNIELKYYKKLAGAIIVFDLSNKESFNNIYNWVNFLKLNANKYISIILVGNKSDLLNGRKVSEDEIKILTKKLNLYYIETSAKAFLNIENVFKTISKNICNKIKNEVIYLVNEEYGIKEILTIKKKNNK